MSRVYTLIVYRMISVGLLLVYEILGGILGFPVIDLPSVVVLSAVYGLFNWTNVVVYDRVDFVQPSIAYLFFTFVVDIVFLSGMVFIVGWEAFGTKIGYMIVVVVSSLFLDKIYIYVLALLSVSFYLLIIQISNRLMLNSDDIQSVNNEWPSAVVGQFVAIFSTALISVFIQSTYRKARQALVDKERSIGFLRETRRRIVESLPSGLITANRMGQINYVNPVGEKLLHKEAVTLWGQNLFQIFDLPEFKEIPGIKIPLQRYERRIRIANSLRDFGITISQFQFESGEEAFLVLFQDLTKIKSLEAQKKLEDRMSAFGKMAAGVAHEIRNPLAAMSGSIQVLKELIPDDATAQELAGIIQKESTRLNEIISQFLAYARPGTPSKMDPIRLDKILCDFIMLVKNDPNYANLKFHFESEGNCTILGDEAKLLQVFWNLVKNSWKACGGEGEIIISLKVDGDFVQLKFIDNGIGMGEEELRDLFTPFQSFSKGTGLGMSIVYDIIHMHRGQIEVQSEPGKGTEIELRFSVYEE